jgi:nickel/cobalt transporter (NicO) family protein
VDIRIEMTYMTDSDLISILVGSFILSLLHALIPNHWLPVLAISRKEKWTLSKTTLVTVVSGLAHAVSTAVIGIIIGLLGIQLAEHLEHFTHVIAPIVLIGLGLFYICQHHRHKHFHLHADPRPRSANKVVLTLVVAMFFSPCFEIEAYFLMAGAHGWSMVLMLALLYTVVTVAGMVIWIRLAYQGLHKLNWHTLEHNAGIITGITLVLTGISSFFIH